MAAIFEPDRLEETCRALAEAQEPPLVDDDRTAAARQVLVDCDARLARYREALEAGTDPAVVSGWIQRSKLCAGRPRKNFADAVRRRRPPRTTSGR